MNTRLTALAAVLAFLTPTTSTLHAQVLAATDGIDVPDGTRKCIKPKERAPKPIDLFTPLTCLEAVVNVSATLGNQAESFVVVNPTNTNNLVAFSNNPGTASIFRAYSTDGGANWTRGTVATGVACCRQRQTYLSDHPGRDARAHDRREWDVEDIQRHGLARGIHHCTARHYGRDSKDA